MAFDVTVAEVPADSPKEVCGGPCVPLIRTGGKNPYWLSEGYRNRIVVLDINGEVVTAFIESPADEEFEGFVRSAEEVLSTVRWGG